MHWQKVLQRLIHKNDLHGKFLNTLSLLEYIGARKIMKSQMECDVTPMTLAHISEEVRHAQVFKKLAMRVAGPIVSGYSEKQLLCGREGRAYIHAVDQTAADVIGTKNTWTNYLLTTLIVEERAQKLYPFYDELLGQLDLSGPLKAIVKEEEGHLEQVQTCLESVHEITAEKVDQVRTVEKTFFDDFFLAVNQQLENAESVTSFELH